MAIAIRSNGQISYPFLSAGAFTAGLQLTTVYFPLFFAVAFPLLLAPSRNPHGVM